MLTTAINGGVVVDVRHKARHLWNIGLENGKIAQIAEEPLEAEQVIDARGLVVSPGFIDVHGHVDGEDYAGILSACQGITTTVGGNCGCSPKNLEAFFSEQERRGFPIHQAMLVGHQTSLREEAGAMDRYQPATEEQIEKMVTLAEDALRQGACGVSFGLDYVPGSSLEEVIALAKVCQKCGKICPVHTRLLTNKDLYSLYELFQVARKTKAQILISHFVYQYCNGLVGEGLKMVEKARAEGLDIQLDSGMYTNWTTYFDTATFDLENIRNNQWKWDQMVVATGQYKGRVMDEDLYYHMKKECPGEAIVFFEGEEQEVYDCMVKPYVMPSTDIGAYEKGEGHPQIAGTYPKYFREMVRELQLLSLEEAVYKATLLPAQVFGLSQKGEIAVGKDGDLTLFNLETICDRADYPHLGEPDAIPEGIPYVLVDGVLAVDQGVYTGSRSGKIIRK